MASQWRRTVLLLLPLPHRLFLLFAIFVVILANKIAMNMSRNFSKSRCSRKDFQKSSKIHKYALNAVVQNVRDVSTFRGVWFTVTFSEVALIMHDQHL